MRKCDRREDRQQEVGGSVAWITNEMDRILRTRDTKLLPWRYSIQVGSQEARRRCLAAWSSPPKTFSQVREVLTVIENKFKEAEYLNRDKKQKTFPGVEFLPSVQQIEEAKKPAPKKETGYKKITLGQPAFNRKTRANNEYIKDMAAKQGSPSKTPKSSRSSSASKNSPPFKKPKEIKKPAPKRR